MRSIGDLLFLSVKGKCGRLITMQDNDVPLRHPKLFWISHYLNHSFFN